MELIGATGATGPLLDKTIEQEVLMAKTINRTLDAYWCYKMVQTGANEGQMSDSTGPDWSNATTRWCYGGPTGLLMQNGLSDGV